MKIHEYQAMSLFTQYGIEIVPSQLAESVNDVASIAKKLGGKVVVKSQVLVGGRGKAGGIKLAKSVEEAVQHAGKIFGMKIKNIPVEKVLVAQAVTILKEYYVGITIDRTTKTVVFVASASGGVDIEELAVNQPEKIQKLYVQAPQLPDPSALDAFLKKAFVTPKLFEQAKTTFLKLYKLFLEKECSLVEINPYAQLDNEMLVAADAKINFDDNGLYKNPDIEALRNPEEYSDGEIAAREAGLSFVSLDGDIGCIVNGAGLAMATMDIIKLYGGAPANFLDVGGSSNPEKVLNALRIILSNKKVKGVLINIFGGITRCDDIANGIMLALKKLDIRVPLVVRLVGTNEAAGKKILEDAGYVVASEMTDAVKKVIKECA
ncbi:ADP-forming succinate--CoA ligase subunit beta [bacterium]|nr:ADP-forming succinate--CoA ligase subunit beta [bacterium]MCP5461978.1 ADP-forming succinate--CoA ligase subunit beta [bacterium]